MTNLIRSTFQAHPFHLVSPSPWFIFITKSQTNYYLNNNPKLVFIKRFSTSINLYKPENSNLSDNDSKITSTNETSTSNRDLADLYERYNDNPAWRDSLQEDIKSNTNREDNYNDMTYSSEKSSLSDFEEEREKFFSDDPSTSDTEELCNRFKDDEQGLHNYMEDKRNSLNEMAERITQFHNRELEKNEINDKNYTELIQEVEAQRSMREQEINDTDEIIKQTNFPDIYDNIEQESNTDMLRELNVSHSNDVEETSSQESGQDADIEDIDMEDFSEASPVRNTESYVPSSSAKSEGESDIDMNDNLSYHNNDNDPRNRGGGSLGGSDGPAESSGTNNSSNRSVIDFVVEIESSTSIFDDWEFFDIM